MKLITSVILFAAILPAQTMQEGRKVFPWDVITVYTCWARITKIQDMTVTRPAPDIGVSLTATVEAGSGWHSHTAPGRPGATLISLNPANGRTGLDGCLTSKWRGPGYSGFIDFLATPQDPSLASHTEGIRNYLGYYDWDVTGKPELLEPFFGFGNAAPSAWHLDVRHGGTITGVGFSRYATRETAGQMGEIAAAFQEHSPGSPLDIIRASLPDGGIADNETGWQPGAAYLMPEWVNRHAETHNLGVEFDITNPKSYANGSMTAYTVMEAIANIWDCKVGAKDQYGVTLPTPGGTTGFWQAQPVIHITCSSSPIH